MAKPKVVKQIESSSGEYESETDSEISRVKQQPSITKDNQTAKVIELANQMQVLYEKLMEKES